MAELLEGLTAEQARAVRSEARALKIVACAGAGKTETLARRLVRLLAEGCPPELLAAFTFTEKAADEMKERIYRCAARFLGTTAPVAKLFVGTMHGFCLQVLRSSGLEALDDHRERALVACAAWDLKLFELPQDRMDPAEVIRQFVRALTVVTNELVDRRMLGPPEFAERLRAYEALLERLRLINFGQLIERLLTAELPALRHVLVDEYQDLNRAQAELVHKLMERGAAVTLVGDERQSIYQWRGADPRLFSEFGETIVLSENRRSRPSIVRLAGRFGQPMTPVRAEAPAVFMYEAADPQDEARWIAEQAAKFGPGNVAILFRSMRTSSGPFLAELERRGIPYTVTGPGGLFRHAEVRGLAKKLAELPESGRGLMDLLYELMREFRDRDDATLARLGRFSRLVSDFESMSRRMRRRKGLVKHLIRFIEGYAKESYSEPSVGRVRDAVTVTTVHQAKGLEWPVVFLPCLVDCRFPSTNTGRTQPWFIDRRLFDAERYEGCEEDERRLFYVAATRARDALYLSWFRCYDGGRRARRSRFLEGVEGDVGEPAVEPVAPGEEIQIYPVKDLLLYRRCPYRYKLERVFGFLPELSPVQGYGHAVHEILRELGERGIATPEGAAKLALERFYLPFAGGAMLDRLRQAAARELVRYVRQHGEDLRRFEAAEVRVEFAARNAVIRGVADAVLRSGGGAEVREYKTAEDERLLEEAALQVQVYAQGLREQGRVVTGGSVVDLSTGRSRRVDVSEGAVRRALAAAEEAIAGIQAGRFGARPGAECPRCPVRRMCRFVG